jgi:hypothetical protein
VVAEGGRDWEPRGASLARVTCHGEGILDLEEEGQLGQMVQDHWWEAEVARHRTSEALDAGSRDAGQHAVSVDECPHAVRTD